MNSKTYFKTGEDEGGGSFQTISSSPFLFDFFSTKAFFDIMKIKRIEKNENWKKIWYAFQQLIYGMVVQLFSIAGHTVGQISVKNLN